MTAGLTCKEDPTPNTLWRPGVGAPPWNKLDTMGERERESSAGDGFLQIGDWRLAALHSHYFTFSHRSLHSDGHTHSGPRRDHHSWDREPHIASSIKFGDRFIEFGHWWRLGEWDDGRHLVLSHRNNRAPIIWRSLVCSCSAGSGGAHDT